MAKSKKDKKIVVNQAVKPKKKSIKTASRKGKRGGSVGGAPRTCGACGRIGHNRRSHDPGGKLSNR